MPDVKPEHCLNTIHGAIIELLHEELFGCLIVPLHQKDGRMQRNQWGSERAMDVMVSSHRLTHLNSLMTQPTDLFGVYARLPRPTYVGVLWLGETEVWWQTEIPPITDNIPNRRTHVQLVPTTRVELADPESISRLGAIIRADIRKRGL